VSSEQTLRARRVAHSIKRAVTDVLARDVSDPLLSGIVVTDVEVTADLGIATIRVRLFVEADDPRRRRATMDSLSRASGRLRKSVGSLGLKRVPELRFAYDVGADAARRVEELLADIAREKKPE